MTVGDYLFTMPAGLTIDMTNITAFLPVVGSAVAWKPTNMFGTASMGVNATTAYAMTGSIFVYSGTMFRMGGYGDGVEGMWCATNGQFSAATTSQFADFMVPISGWYP